MLPDGEAFCQSREMWPSRFAGCTDSSRVLTYMRVSGIIRCSRRHCFPSSLIASSFCTFCARYRYDADTESSYVIIFSPDTLLLSKSGEGPGVFSSIKTPVMPDRWHQAEITGWAGRIQVTLDGKVVMDVLDPQPLQQGTIGLSPFLGDPDALVDDIEVMPAGPEPLQPPPPTESPALAPPTEPPPPSPEIHCQPENATIELGECTELSWDIRNVKAVYLNDAPAKWRDERKEGRKEGGGRVCQDRGTALIKVPSPPLC